MNKPSLATKKKNITLTLNQPKKSGATKTVVVLGVERGGAGVIRALGIDMGRRAWLNHEDPLFLTDEKDRLKNRINICNDQGWTVHDKLKPQLIYRLAAGEEQILPNVCDWQIAFCIE